MHSTYWEPLRVLHRELNKIDRDGREGGREGGRERERGEKGAQQGRVFVLTPTAVRYHPQL